jgi:hypothetical protein
LAFVPDSTNCQPVGNVLLVPVLARLMKVSVVVGEPIVVNDTHCP